MANKTFCQYCKAIDYASLPSEDESGVAHHPNLPSLVKSAEVCPLCELLLRCGYRNRTFILSEPETGPCPTGVDFSQGDGVTQILRHGDHWREIRLTRNTGSGKTKISTAVTVLGSYPPGGLGEKYTDSEDILDAIIPYDSIWDLDNRMGFLTNSKFRNDDTVKPWLFGSWWSKIAEIQKGNWTAPEPNDLQLIGIGMRFGTSPKPEDGEGNRKDLVVHRGTHLRVRTLKDHSTSSFILGRPRCAFAGSLNATSWIFEQIGNCEEHHNDCQPKSAIAPTRIVHLRAGADRLLLRLVEPKDAIDKYVALSHCWGTNRTTKTTTENLSSHKVDISFAGLPQTFREAIKLTWELGVRYIWIDSLCIIQDSLDDWANEAPRMADVYSYAYLTFAASHSTGTDSGLYPPKDVDRKAPCQTPTNRSLGKSTQGEDSPLIQDIPGNESSSNVVAFWPMEIVPYKYNGHDSQLLITQEWMPASTSTHPRNSMIGAFGKSLDPLEGEHLSTRAWTLQERILSPRVLHFASDQMYWECRSRFIAEDGTQFPRRTHDIEQIVGNEALPNSQCGRQWEGASDIESYAFFDKSQHGRWDRGWLQHIEDFCARQLTNENDKLHALSGLVNKMQAMRKDGYMAGNWFSHGLEDLCWRTKPFDERRVLRKDLSGFRNLKSERRCYITKASKYRAPSWSWASLNGRIEFLPIDFYNTVGRPIYAEVEPVTANDSMGNLKSGWLHIKGPLLPIRIAAPGTKFDKHLPLGFGTLCELDTISGLSMGEVYFDLESTASISSSFAIVLETMKTSFSVPDAQGSQAKRSSFSLFKRHKRSSSGQQWKTSAFLGLFLDASLCLVLKPREPGIIKDLRRPGQLERPVGGASSLQAFERVGVGNFLRTRKQILDANKGSGNRGGVLLREGDKLGPVDEKHRLIDIIIF